MNVSRVGQALITVMWSEPPPSSPMLRARALTVDGYRIPGMTSGS
jgi:hypothetical protein